MDTSGQAAEQIVRYSIEGMEYTLKLAGKGAEHLAAMLMALNRAKQKTRGHTTLRALLKSGKELTVFSIPPDRLKEFAQEAKRYGVLYCALKDKTPSAITDILVRAEDAAKLSRIVERLGLGTVSQTAQAEVEPIDKEIADSEALLEQILTPPEKEQQNPTMAQTENSDPSGRGSMLSNMATESRPSVRAALQKIRQSQKDSVAEVQTELHIEKTIIKEER